VGVNDWNWRHPTEFQDVPWDCAAASLAWALQAYGVEITEDQVVAGLGPARISPTHGLLDASGAGLVSYLAEIGIPAANNSDASFQELLDAAGYQPMVIGGRYWCHWSGVRMGGPAFGKPEMSLLVLANPSPGWMGVTQLFNEDNWQDLGPFSAVWFPV
jgi:hypothetical protein